MSRPKKRARAERAVHYTEHACVAHGLMPDGWGIVPREGERAARDLRLRRTAERERIEKIVFGGWPPAWPPAELWWCYAPGDGVRFTTSLAKVTCGRCRRRYESARAYNRHTTRQRCEARLRAWFSCCRHVGAPSPMTDAQTKELLAQERAAIRRESLDLFARLGHAAMLGLGLDKDEDFRATIGRYVGTLDDDIREALRPAIDEYTMASDLLVEVGAMFGRAKAIATDVAGRLAPTPTGGAS